MFKTITELHHWHRTGKTLF